MALPVDDRGENGSDLLRSCERVLLWPRVAAGAGIALLGLLVQSAAPAVMELVGGWMAATSFVAWVYLGRRAHSRRIAVGTTVADVLASVAVLGVLGATPDGTGVVLFPLLGFELVLEAGIAGLGMAAAAVGVAIGIRMSIRVVGFGLPPRPGALLLMAAATLALSALASALRAAEQRRRTLEMELSALVAPGSERGRLPLVTGDATAGPSGRLRSGVAQEGSRATAHLRQFAAGDLEVAVDEGDLADGKSGEGRTRSGEPWQDAGNPRKAPPDWKAGRPVRNEGPAVPDVPLTRREREVLVLLAAGRADGEVARTLGLSRGTVRVHVSNAMRKLRATDREEALVAAGLVLTGGEDLSDATERRAGP